MDLERHSKNTPKMFKEKYGQQGTKDFRRLERLHQKRARLRNHLRFCLRCRDENITPTSLQLKTSIRTKTAQNIIERAQRALLKERIRNVITKQRRVEDELERGHLDLKRNYKLDKQMEELIKGHMMEKQEKEFIKVKERHIKKLNRLINKKKRGEIQGNSTPNSWVCNISQYKLTEAEESILKKGLNFAVTPKVIPYDDFIVATELACQQITDEGKKAELRNNIVGILKNSQIQHSNITKEEQSAMAALSKNEQIIILPADKGRTTVVMDKEKYKQQMKQMLEDKNTYAILKKDPTENIKKNMKKLLKPLHEKGKITEKMYKHWIHTANITPRIYGTPKIHKQNTPLRPIVDSISTPTYNMAKDISRIISPLLGNTDQHCKNSIELAKELKEITIEDNDILISHDVTSLFTKTPTQKTIDIVVNRIRQDKTLHKRTNLTADDIAQLIGLVANSTYFTYDNTIYKQLEGFAMGNPLSATLCEFFMEDLEQKAIATAPPNCKIKLWKRYVDDILEIIPKGQTETLTQHLNNIDGTGNIKFTYELETEGSIAFMDMKITRQTDGTLNINTYRKPTHTDQYLLWTSEHPTIHKMSVIRTLYHRANIITEERDRKQEDKHIQHALKTCRYPTWAINKGKQQTKTESKEQPKQRTRNPERQEPKPVITLPYIRGITEKIRATMKKHNINTPTKPYTTVRNRLVHPKDKISAGQKCGVIYEIPCKICNKTYIGETGRQLNTRTIEHRKECEKEANRKHTRAAKEEAESTIKSQP
ncbi:uncharacterized protein [Nothobranchius furzeri]|uniref:uncharacterized protein n=1 Tax=Nothobranchius furzeri TaxID=105023 RepID=UPI0039048C37